MIISDLIRGVAIVMVPLFFIHSENIIPIYAIIFFTFASACFFLPARLSVIPSLVSAKDLLLANSASSITWVFSGVIGFSLGGFLAEWIGIRSSLFLNSFVYFLSAFSFLCLLVSMRGQPHEDTSGETAKTNLRRSLLLDLREGLRTLLFDNTMKFVIYIFFTLSSIVGAIYIVAIVFIQETMHSMTRYIGLVGMCLFLGVLLGSFIFGKIGQRLPRTQTIYASLMGAGIFITVFAFSLKIMKSLLFGGVAALLLGFFIAPTYVTANTIIHESSESRVRGRIFSYVGIVMNAGFLIFMLVSSAVAERVDRFWILIICGSLLIVFGMIKLIGALAGFTKNITSSS